MADSMSYEQARKHYKQLMRLYGEALENKTGDAPELLVQAEEAWDRVRALSPPDGLEANVTREMHFVLAFCHAVAADDEAEAERLYQAMSEDDRRNTDIRDANNPGTMKIWLRGNSP